MNQQTPRPRPVNQSDEKRRGESARRRGNTGGHGEGARRKSGAAPPIGPRANGRTTGREETEKGRARPHVRQGAGAKRGMGSVQKDDSVRNGEVSSAPIRCDEGALEALVEALRRDRRERGPEIADAAWIDAPLDEWLHYVSGDCPGEGCERGRGEDEPGECGEGDECYEDGEDRRAADEPGSDVPCARCACLAQEAQAALAVAMREILAVRDMLILSLIMEPDRVGKRELIRFASRPHRTDTQRGLYDLLGEAFDDAGHAPNTKRCRAGVTALIDMSRCMPESFAVQPLAVAAYTLWWMGDRLALPCSLECLALDDDCSLAAIVCAACDHDVWPAWCGVARARAARDGVGMCPGRE